MAQPTEILQHLLLDLLSARRTVAPDLIARLNEGDWRRIMEKETIDWPLFWQLVQDTGSSRGCLLTLEMVERYFGEYVNDLYDQTPCEIITQKKCQVA